MSVLFSCEKGWFISHEDFINTIYKNVECDKTIKPYRIYTDLFKIISPFTRLHTKHNLKRKLQSEQLDNFNQLKQAINHVEDLYRELRGQIQNLLLQPVQHDKQVKNEQAIELSKKVYDESGKAAIKNAVGENIDTSKYVTIDDNRFIFPANCKFYCKDVAQIESYLADAKYDLIVLDPPWWNKYVRRKKAKTNHGYSMLYNDDLKAIPVEKLLDDKGLVVVWCTNSQQHLDDLKNSIFLKWNVHFVAQWYWLKITQSGDPICGFSAPPGKQPFEQIIFGCRNARQTLKPVDGKLVVSIPSALHSHKPPLAKLLGQYLPENPRCLELFARYLLPNFTSWGLEAIRFQHESLYEPILRTTE